MLTATRAREKGPIVLVPGLQCRSQQHAAQLTPLTPTITHTVLYQVEVAEPNS